MTNGFNPKTFDFKKQTAAHNLQTAGSGNATSWEHLWQLGGVKPWQMKYDEDDIRVAELAGASPYGLQQLITEAKSRGLEIGKKTTKRIDALRASQPESFKAPINYGALGGYGFDISDIDSMWGTGPADDKGVAYGITSPEWTAGLDKVRDAWTWAQDQNLPNSSGVGTWIQNKDNEYRDEKLRIEREAADEALRKENEQRDETLRKEKEDRDETLRIEREAADEALRLETVRLAEEDRLFQQKLAEDNRLFQQKIEDDRKVEAANLKIETARLAEEDRLFQQGIADAQAAATQKAAEEAEVGRLLAREQAEAGRLASSRGGGSQTLGASGTATFKGKGLKSSENKRGKGRGTGQFKRPYGTSNLSIAATGKGNQHSTLNL
jgi:hypothetical protein